MVENESLRDNHCLKNNLISFGTFFKTFRIKLFLIFLLQQLDPCSCGGPVRVVLEVPYGSCRGPLSQLWRFRLPRLLPVVRKKSSIVCPVYRSQSPLVDRHQVRQVSANWTIKGADGASTATVWALHNYQGHPYRTSTSSGRVQQYIYIYLTDPVQWGLFYNHLCH